MKVAFIGLGNMGSGIAQCVLKGGFDLTVWNRTASKMEPLVEKGTNKGQSTRIRASYITLAHFSICARKKASNSSGMPATTSLPSRARRSRICGVETFGNFLIDL